LPHPAWEGKGKGRPTRLSFSKRGRWGGSRYLRGGLRRRGEGEKKKGTKVSLQTADSLRMPALRHSFRKGASCLSLKKKRKGEPHDSVTRGKKGAARSSSRCQAGEGSSKGGPASGRLRNFFVGQEEGKRRALFSFSWTR